ncbi:U6 snRNA-associated Sm-like protein LSm4 [Aphelenchoides bicaudatus]|nr:U6 snRNA-associated Sm-like protein LSm4 [Aphelenchoides bicaudatus]
MFAGASQTHTFPFVLISSIWLVCSFPQSNNLLIWTELFLFTQFPSAFEFFFGLAKYRQFTYVWSLFGLPALIFITNCGAFLAFKSKNSRSILALIYLSLEIPLIVWLLREKALDSLLALDSLSLLCTLFMTFELTLIRWNNEFKARVNMVLPLSLLKTAQNHPMLIELKNGETYNGVLISCDSWMNVHLRDAICTSKDGDRFTKIPEVYVRGATIKYLRIPEEVVELVKDEVKEVRRQQRDNKQFKRTFNNRGGGRGGSSGPNRGGAQRGGSVPRGGGRK